MKKKNSILLIFVFFLSLWSLFIPRGKTDLTNVWGVNIGESESYRLLKEVKGSISGTMEEYLLQYLVMDFVDDNSNTYADIFLSIFDFSTQPMSMSQEILPDTDDWLYPRNLVLLGYRDITTLYGSFLNLDLTFVLPISFHSPDIGLDWDNARNFINSSYPNYIAYVQGNRTIITYNNSNIYDSTIQAYFNETGLIIWDEVTGWLESVEFIRTYEETLGFSFSTTITPHSKSSSGDSTLQGIIDILAWFGLGMGILGVCLALYTLKKVK